MNREIVFSARDNGVTSFMDKMRQSSVDVGRGILQDSMAQSKSAKEAISNYERQISLIEKKNRLERDSAKLDAERNRDAKLGSATTSTDRAAIDDKYKTTIKDIDRGTKEDKVQTDLLRELIQTVKTTSNQELRSDAITGQGQEDDLERFLSGADSTEFRKAAEQLREEREGVSKDKKSGGGGGGIVAGAAGVAGSGSGDQAIQRTLGEVGKGPILGTIAGLIAIAVAGLTIRSQREKSAEQYAAMSGRSVGSIIDGPEGATDFFGGYGPSKLGVSREDFLSTNVPGAVRAAGTSRGGAERAMRHLEIEKALALTSGTGDTMAKLGRATGGDATSMTNQIFSAMSGTGAFGGGTDMARMQDIISGIMGFQEGELSRAGVTSMRGTLAGRRGLERLGGRFTRDDYSMQTLAQMNQGLTSEGSPEARAIKFDILRRQNPNKSFFELQTEMEQGINSKGYMQGMLNFVKGTGGDMNAQSILLDSLTGGAMRKKDISSILQGNMSLEDFDTQTLDTKGRALSSTSRANEQLLNATEQFKDVMSGLGGGVEAGIEMMRGMGETMDGISKSVDKILNFFD